MTTISQQANIPNCILTQLSFPAAAMFSNSFEQLYKNSDITGFLNVERSQLRALGSSRRRAFELRHHGQAKIRLSGLEVEFRQDGLT